MLNRRSFLAGTLGSLVRPPTAMQGPILTADKPHEGTCAMPFSGGIFKGAVSWRCYYLSNFRSVALAYSDDGLTWTKPDLGIIPGTNLLMTIKTMDSFSVVAHEGYWYMTVSHVSGGPLQLFTSRNGLWWTKQATMPFAGDRTTCWWNPVKERWTFNVRMGGGTGGDPRRIDRVESDRFVPRRWNPEPWLRAEAKDGADEAGSVQLYAVDVVAGDSRLIGLFSIFRGLEPGRPKLNDVCLGFSTDGDSWERQYTPILTRGEPGSWNFGNVQSVGNGIHQVNGKVRLYASGRAGNGKGGNGICSMGYREVEAL